jgi:hypothetical protein
MGQSGGTDNCILVMTDVGATGWVHWAMNVAADRSIAHFVDGSDRTSQLAYAHSWCGAQGGTLVLAQDQDAPGASFDANQAPEISILSLRVHEDMLTTQQITSIAAGTFVAGTLWSDWRFDDASSMGHDWSTGAQHFERHGGSVDDIQMPHICSDKI